MSDEIHVKSVLEHLVDLNTILLNQRKDELKEVLLIISDQTEEEVDEIVKNSTMDTVLIVNDSIAKKCPSLGEFPFVRVSDHVGEQVLIMEYKDVGYEI